MIHAVAIDDEPLALEIIEAYCSDIDYISLDRTFTQTTEARKYLSNYPVDLIFLDINMPSISGIDFYKGLQQDTMVIFTTAHAHYALDGFELSAVDFLLKPYSPERFATAVNKAHEFHQYLQNKVSGESRHIYIRSEYSLIKVLLSDVDYIEGLADYLKIHLTNSKTLLTRMTMKSVLSKLPEKEFVRVHRSFIIPLNSIEGVRNKTVHLKGGHDIPIGASYEDEFRKVFRAPS